MRTVILALTLLLLPLPVAAQTSGTVAGIVTDATNGNPVDMAVVLFYRDNDTIVGTGNTDPTGHYTASLPAGTVYATVLATGYANEVYSHVPCVAADCARTAGTPVVVNAGATTPLDIPLTREGRVAGVVRAATDASILDGAAVYLFNQAGSLVNVVAQGTSGYHVDRLPAGTYYAAAISPRVSPVSPDFLDELYGGLVCPWIAGGPTCSILAGTPIVVSAGATATADFSLDPGGHIGGRITTAQPPGTPLSSVSVAAYLGTTRVGNAGIADASGFYTITALPSGTYTVRATPVAGSATEAADYVEEWYDDVCVGCGGRARGVTVTAGLTTTGIDFALAIGGAIAGSLTWDVPLPGGVIGPDVLLFDAHGVLLKQMAGGSPPLVPGASHQGGTVPFRFSGVAPGAYYVRTINSAPFGEPMVGATRNTGRLVDELFDNIVCVASDCAPTHGNPVTVAAGATTGNINFTLDYGASIEGTAGGEREYDIYDSRGVALQSQRIARWFDGYTAPGLPAGAYYVKVRRASVGLASAQLYKDTACTECPVTSGTPVVVRPGEQKTGIDFTVVPGYTIAGTVRADVSAAPLSTIAIEIYSRTGALVASSRSLADGTYRVRGLNPGTYYARTLNQRGFVDEIYNDLTCGACDATRGTAIVIGSADVAGIDFGLAAGQTVSGSITDSTHATIPHASVSFFTSSPEVPVAGAAADVLGRFTLTLPAGSYGVRSDPLADFVQEMFNDVPCPQGLCDGSAATHVDVAGSPVANIDFALASCTAAVISPVRLASAAVGTAYRQTLGVAGATGAVRYSVAAGVPPPGLALDPVTGVIAGTPTAAGPYAFTVTATDALGCTASREYALDVPACAFRLDRVDASLRAHGEPWLVHVTDACGTWTAMSNDAWIQATRQPGDNVILVASPNTAPDQRTGTVTIGPRVFTVHQSGTAATPPFGVIDIPTDGALAFGSLPLSGWALDDLGVLRVLIYRDPVPGESPGFVFIGTATIVPGARPDVEAAFPGFPFNRRAGWGYLLLTNMLPNQGNGTFRIHVFAEDADLNLALIGSRSIVVDNATALNPFGAIDTPGQGATIAGAAYLNWGWALTPQPKTIPTDGSTIQVYIDGVPVGPVTYNLFRPDVATLFPGLNNSSGPVGYRVIDTTALSEGLHTIAWVATDDQGRAAGIGSRYFTVENSAWTATVASVLPAGIAASDSTTRVPETIAGADLGRRMESVASLDAAPPTTIDIRPTGRVELDLTQPADASCRATYDGYLAAGGELKPLPVGAALDGTGHFYWQPGPAFFGEYELLFIRTACDGRRTRASVTVRIGAR